MNPDRLDIREGIRKELEISRTTFHRILDSLPGQDFQKQSLNPGWTNGEIIARMTFGFIVINALLPMARLWGRYPGNQFNLDAFMTQ